jgi:hypothetical protein
MPAALAATMLAVMIGLANTGTADATSVSPLDRVKLHRDSGRSVPYLPLAQQGARAGALNLTMRPIKKIELDGAPLQNTYSNLLPADVDGDGIYEFIQYNGYRFMQVWDAAGKKLWRIANPEGRLHDYTDGTHRDSVAILDLDGDDRDDVAHCWALGSRKLLVYRRGWDGAVFRSVVLTGSPGEDCQIAAFRFAQDRRTLILVSHRWKSTPACKTNDFVDTWARTVAFDIQQRQVWNTRTCDAGHYAWPLDEDFDGWAEGVFVGKYLLGPHGHIRCVLSTWPQRDHVDSLAVADLDLGRPGLEAVAVGRTGLAMFDPTDCKQIWRIASTVIRDPQHVAVAKLDPSSNVPQIVVDERGSIKNARTFVISGQGKIMASNKALVMPMQNANLDGALGIDEKVGNFGRVIDRWGNLRLSRAWYWNLKGSRVTETASGPYPLTYDRWQGFPLVFDYDRDGRDEIVTWGQSLIVVGKAF